MTNEKCTCIEYQLYQVGCDCGFVEKVDVWTVVVHPSGYAREEDPKTMRVFSNQNVDSEVFRAFGPFARVLRIIKPVAYVPPVSQAAAMAYSRNDNS